MNDVRIPDSKPSVASARPESRLNARPGSAQPIRLWENDALHTGILREPAVECDHREIGRQCERRQEGIVPYMR